MILAKLKANNGELMLSDKSPPEAVYAAFGVSKKVFKQALGALYKQELIIIEKSGIKLR
jgi:predicted RNA-binding protein (virulence factor B family)